MDIDNDQLLNPDALPLPTDADQPPTIT